MMSSAMRSPHSPRFLELARVSLSLPVVADRSAVVSACCLICTVSSPSFSLLPCPTSSTFFCTSDMVRATASRLLSIRSFLP